MIVSGDLSLSLSLVSRKLYRFYARAEIRFRAVNTLRGVSRRLQITRWQPIESDKPDGAARDIQIRRESHAFRDLASIPTKVEGPDRERIHTPQWYHI